MLNLIATDCPTWAAPGASANGTTPAVSGLRPCVRTRKRLALVSQNDPLRPAVESCIREVYANAFGASDPLLSPTLVAWLDADGKPVCAAGLRAAPDRLFSQAYLDAPIESLLSAIDGQPVSRESIFEINTLASRSPGDSLAFIHQVVSLGREAGFSWSCFTATARLRRLLEAMGVRPHVLAPATSSRLADAERWGAYYGHDPMVCVASGPCCSGKRWQFNAADAGHA